MTPHDERALQEQKLLDAARTELGVKEPRVFKSAEGDLAPLTLLDANAFAEALGPAIAGASAAQIRIDSAETRSTPSVPSARIEFSGIHSSDDQ